MLQTLDKWHRTKLGLLVFALVELVITYGFASLSIDRGNLLWYLLTLIFLVGTLRNIFKFIGTFFNSYGNRRKAR
jgi:hypothetical protein